MTLFGRLWSTTTSLLRCLAKQNLKNPSNDYRSSFTCVCKFSAQSATSESSNTDIIDANENYEFGDLQLDPSTSDLDLREQQDLVQPMMWDRRIPRSLKEFKSLATSRPVQQVANPKLLRVSIIGSPNAGKSTLTNQIIGWKVSSVSTKVHTTRRNTLAIMTENNVQIVLVDTPGVINAEHGKKHRLERSLVVDPEASISSVDVIAVLVDASMKYTENGLDPLILSILYKNPLLDSILILNKVDLISKKSKLLELCRTLTCGVVDDSPIPRFDNAETFLTKKQKNELFTRKYYENVMGGGNDPETKFWNDVDAFQKLTTNLDKKIFLERKKGWPRFKDVFMISALNGDGTNEIKNYFVQNARVEDWRFNPALVSNQSPKDIALMAVREKLLDNLRMKLPYQIELYMEEWTIDDRGTLRITVKLKCPRKGAMKHVMGENGARIRQIAYEAGQEMMNSFRCEVLLKLVVAY